MLEASFVDRPHGAVAGSAVSSGAGCDSVPTAPHPVPVRLLIMHACAAQDGAKIQHLRRLVQQQAADGARRPAAAAAATAGGGDVPEDPTHMSTSPGERQPGHGQQPAVRGQMHAICIIVHLQRTLSGGSSSASVSGLADQAASSASAPASCSPDVGLAECVWQAGFVPGWSQAHIDR